jgi:hypothetical protein
MGAWQVGGEERVDGDVPEIGMQLEQKVFVGRNQMNVPLFVDELTDPPGRMSRAAVGDQNQAHR